MYSRLGLEQSHDPINNREKHVVLAVFVRVMEQVMPGREAQALRQAATHVSAPVNFLERDVVERERDERARRPAILEDPLQRQERNGVREKQRDNAQRIAREIDVAGGLGGIQSLVMHHVLVKEESLAGVQDESMQTVLERIGVEKPQDKAGQDAGYGIREKVKRGPDQNGADQSRGEEIVPLDSQALRRGLSPNLALGPHADTLARSAHAFKHARRPAASGATTTECPASLREAELPCPARAYSQWEGSAAEGPARRAAESAEVREGWARGAWTFHRRAEKANKKRSKERRRAAEQARESGRRLRDRPGRNAFRAEC